MAALSARQRALRAATALVLAAAAQCASGASDASGYLLPPGLYQIDSKDTISVPGSDISSHGQLDGASGDIVERSQIGNVAGPQLTYKGSAPVTRCVARPKPGYPPIDGSSKCNRDSMRKVGDATEYTAFCHTGTVKITIRRLDEVRWEEVTEVTMGSETTPPNLMSLKPMLQLAVRQAKNPAERAAARKQLAELASLQQQMVDKRAETADALAAAMRKASDAVERESLRKAIASLGGTTQMNARTRTVLTRIAGSCNAAAPN